MEKNAKADVKPVRQRTQYTCVATSVTMALNALGKDLTEDQVNRILGCEPKKGARWEEAIATIQYFGCRGTLTAPSTLAQIKEWTDSWRPVLISWNPEGRPWSHASCVFHVEQGPPEIWAEDVGDDALIQGSGPGLYVWIADPNIPNPNKTYRIIHENEFYAKWGEDWGDFIVRRPALMVDLEITPEGRQVMASKSAKRRGKRPQQNVPKRDKNKPMRIKIDPTKSPGKDPFSNTEKHRRNDGAHGSKKDYRRKPKHQKPYSREAESDSTIGTAELQSSFYKTLEGEMVQMTPLRMQPDYGEKTMDINEMLEQLKQEEDNSLTASAMEETLKTANARPAGGLYGYTKSTQRDVFASVRKVQKSANRIAKAIYAKDKNTFNFLHLHAERSNSLSARILCAAMENIGPKFATEKTAVRNTRFNPDTPKAEAALEKVYKMAAKEYVQALYKHLGSNKKAFLDAWSATSPGKSGKFDDWVSRQLADKASNQPSLTFAAREVTKEVVGWLNDSVLTNQLKLGSFEAASKTASLRNGDKVIHLEGDSKMKGVVLSSDGGRFGNAKVKWSDGAVISHAQKDLKKVSSTKTAAGHGMYGYRVKTAKLALQACLDISQEAGSVAYDLHTRRTAKYAKITSFLKDHSKRGRCRYARLLLRLYPEMPNTITASDEDEKKADEDEKEAKHEKGKKVPLKDMPKELQEQAKNPANHFKKKKAKLSPALEQMLEGMHERNLKEITRWKATDKMTKDLIEGAKAELKRQKSATEFLIAQAEEILKNAGGCDSPKLPDALKAQCKEKEEEGKDSDDSDDKEKKEASGCDKLPPALKENCEKGPPNAKKKDSDSKEAESDDEKDAGLKKLLGNPISDAIKDGLNPKKASRTRLTARIANGELQRGEVRFASEDQEDEDQKDAGYEGRSQLPGEEESNEKQPRTDSGYNPGGTEFNGDQGKAAADESELKEKAEGRTYLPGDEEADKIQPDMNQHGYDAGAVAKLSADYETVTGVTNLPDGATLYWVE